MTEETEVREEVKSDYDRRKRKLKREEETPPGRRIKTVVEHIKQANSEEETKTEDNDIEKIKSSVQNEKKSLNNEVQHIESKLFPIFNNKFKLQKTLGIKNPPKFKNKNKTKKIIKINKKNIENYFLRPKTVDSDKERRSESVDKSRKRNGG